MVKPNCSNFRIITAFFGGVRIYQIFRIPYENSFTGTYIQALSR